MRNPQTILFIGLGITFVLSLLSIMKLLRNDKTLVILFFLTLIIATYGFLIRNDVPVLKGGYSTDFLYSPWIFIVGYGSLRFLFKRKYGIEPTYNHLWKYDFEDNREIKALDIITHLLPFFASLLIPAIW